MNTMLAQELNPVATDTSYYLAHDEIIDWRHEAIQRRSQTISAAYSGEVEKARALYNWVRDAIPHTHDAGREEVTCRASEVLAAGTGICYAKSHLLAAMLRASAIPAGFCYQTYFEPLHASKDKTALHGLNAIHLSSLGKWIRVDCRGNTNGAHAEFDTESEQLAFPELNFLDNVIYAKPLNYVVNALQTWLTCSALWPNLPQPSVEHPLCLQ